MYKHVRLAVPDMAKDVEEFAEAIYNLEDMLNDPDVTITIEQRNRARFRLHELKNQAYTRGILLPKGGRPSDQQVTQMNDETLTRMAQYVAHSLPLLMDIIEMEPLKESIKEFVAREVAAGVEEKWIIGALLGDGGDVTTKILFELAGQIAEAY